MNKWGILLRVHLMGAFGFNKVRHSKDKREKRKWIGLALLIGFSIAAGLASLVFYNIIMADMFSKAGMPELLPAVMMAAGSTVTLVTTIYKVNGLLFAFKDYDMVMAMPVKTATIVASRLSLLYLLNLAFCLCIILPSAILYAVFSTVSPLYFAALPLLALTMPLIPMLAGTAVGLVIAVVFSRFRRANLLNILATVGIVAAAAAFSSGSQSLLSGGVEVGKLMDRVYAIYPMTHMYTRALCEGDFLSLLLFVLLSLALFSVFSLLVGRYYKRMNTALTTSRARGGYRLAALKTSSPLSALYRRELRRYFSSSLYVMNTAMGMIMAILFSGSLLFFQPAELESMLEIPGLAGAVGALAPMILAMMVTMSCTTCSSISLEGGGLWIVKSLPIKPEMLFAAKILVNLTVTIPAAILCALLMAFALPLNAAQLVLLFLTPAAFALLSAQAGLLLNLFHPNFTWTSEVTVIKQSMPVAVSIISGMVLTIGMTIGLIALPETYRIPGLAVITAVVALVNLGLHRLLGAKGARLFQEL